MSTVAVYEIRCPDGHTIELPETILEGITRHLRWSYRGEPVLNFVCSDCKTAFLFDYQNTEPAGQTDAPRQISEFHILSVQTGCDGSNCIEHVLLVAVRGLDKSAESILEEAKMWNVSGVACKRGYPCLPIGTPKWSWLNPLPQ
jgi:hypothetical protein